MTTPRGFMPILWAQLSTMQAIQLGSGIVCVLAVAAMYLEEARQRRRPGGDWFAFDFYRATAAWCFWWCGVATILISTPEIGAMALDRGSYTVASGTALLFVGHVVAALIFIVSRLRELLGWHDQRRVHAARETLA